MKRFSLLYAPALALAACAVWVAVDGPDVSRTVAVAWLVVISLALAVQVRSQRRDRRRGRH